MSVATPAKPARTPIDDRPYEPGDLIVSKYRLRSQLGEGGMGTVWLARNTTLHVDVAIKLIRPEVATNETRQRLLQEARAAAQLDHPNIVRIHDFGETERSEPFIVMELLEGGSLGQRIEERGALDAIWVVQVFLPLLEALAVAHDKGIVHRDLKPDNVMLIGDADELSPKLVDFGIAKLKYRFVETDEQDSVPATAKKAERLTQLGELMGSPAFMSPEQVGARMDVDGRADVWALSVAFYQAVTAQLPFEHEKYEQVFTKILTEDPAPFTGQGVCDELLWRVIDKGLHKDRDRRWKNAREMGVALATWLVRRGVDVDITGRSLAKQWLRGTTLQGRPTSPAVAALAAQMSTDAANSTAGVDVDVAGLARRSHRRNLSIIGAVVGALMLVGLVGVVSSSSEPTTAEPQATSTAAPSRAIAAAPQPPKPDEQNELDTASTSAKTTSTAVATVKPTASPMSSQRAPTRLPKVKRTQPKKTQPKKTQPKKPSGAMPLPEGADF